jgi:hypothetical protein
MVAGEWHEFDGYRFQETLCGPMLGYQPCVDCGHPVLTCGEAAAHIPARCGPCGRLFHGARLEYYGTGRDKVVVKVDSPELQRLRRLANERHKAL